ncbi:hypothetical protein AgCh_008639 [Apium graveolens]
MTLVIDMKLHRLQRVSRCTGSVILSLDTLTGKKLRQCDSFHFEKLVEEHIASGECGKKPSKTLMFLSGCPTRQGCTAYLGITEEVPYSQVQSANMLSTNLVANVKSYSLIQNINGEEKALDSDRTSVQRKAQLYTQNSGGDYKDQTQFMDDINRMFNADGILVLMSRRNSSTGSICEQSHFSHIKFYRNFDIPLGIFLKDNLLNQISNLNEEVIEVFLEAETLLKDISLHFEGSKLKIQGSLREFSDIVEMLRQERRQFEVLVK